MKPIKVFYANISFKMLLEQRMLFQQPFSVKYWHRKPIGFILL